MCGFKPIKKLNGHRFPLGEVVMSSRRLKIFLLTAFVIFYSLSYIIDLKQANASYSSSYNDRLVNDWDLENISQPLPSLAKKVQDPPTTQEPAQDAEPPIATAESIAKKYGSLEKIPIHKVHNEISITDAKTGEVKRLDCLDCHYVADGTTGRNTVRYLGAVNCATCHIEDNDERQKYKSPALPSGRETLGEYSHTAHLDPQARLTANGQRQDCVYCHNPSTAKASMPSHPECYSCHSGPNAAKPIFNEKSQECRGCHSEEKIDRNLLAPNEGRAKTPLVVSAHGSYRDLKMINHAAHLKEKNGATIACLNCHQETLRKSSIDKFAQLPTMNDCSTCHGNIKRVSSNNQMENCSLCHQEVTSSLQPFSTVFEDNANVLRSDKTMPIDHTAYFRLNHQEQARQSNSRCYSCHAGVDQYNKSENCANCHQIMRPRSHISLRFKNVDHGRFAAMTRSNCATCHTTEFCARCHNLLPRDHQPLGVFAGGTHKFQARANMRSCLTCHTYENTCQPCHVPDADGPIVRPLVQTNKKEIKKNR